MESNFKLPEPKWGYKLVANDNDIKEDYYIAHGKEWRHMETGLVLDKPKPGVTYWLEDIRHILSSLL